MGPNEPHAGPRGRDKSNGPSDGPCGHQCDRFLLVRRHVNSASDCGCDVDRYGAVLRRDADHALLSAGEPVKAIRGMLADRRRRQNGSVLSAVLILVAFLAIISGALMTELSTNFLLSHALVNR